jgi:alpha-glucuronidase
LQEEVAQRTSINLRLISKLENTPVIVLALIKDDEISGMPVPKRTGEVFPEMKAEGFRIVFTQLNGKDILWLIGADERGVIFAIGDFLQNSRTFKEKDIIR